MKMNIKIKVTEEQSRAVQEACFAKGIGWAEAGITKITNTDGPYLYICDIRCIRDGKIVDDYKGENYLMFGNDAAFFKTYEAQEMTPEDFITKLNKGDLE